MSREGPMASDARPAGEPHERVLDPLERLSEILFGHIMALTIIGSLSVAGASRDDVRTMLVGAVGCNTAWGIVDAIMYLATLLVERRRALALVVQVRADTDRARARGVIASRVPPFLARWLREDELEHLRAQVVALPELPSAGLTRSDLLAAAAIFLVVFLSTFPVALPFLLPVEPRVALRLSNAVALAMMFAIGFRLGRYMQFRPVLAGLASMAVGTALVAITMALGG